jgi:hypothetical protein
MASNTEQNEYNLFIKPSKVEEVLTNKDDKSTEYIILQNNTLHSKHEELKEDIARITTERDELDSLNDNLSRSKSYLQGIAKNQYLLSQERSKQVVYYKDNIEECYNNQMYIHLLSVPYILMILFRILNYKVMVAVMIITMTGQSHLFHKNYKWKKDLPYHPDIIKIDAEIKVLDKSNDHLHELIDNF